MRKAKQDADIPLGQNPSLVDHVDLVEGGQKVIGENGLPIKVREYHYTNKQGIRIIIQEHSKGHPLATPKHGADPHYT